MKHTVATPARETQRIDRLMWMLRLSHTRTAAQTLVSEGHVRVNGRRVVRCSQPIGAGDVLTIPHGMSDRVVEILALPVRRGPGGEAREHYREPASVSQQDSTA